MRRLLQLLSSHPDTAATDDEPAPCPSQPREAALAGCRAERQRPRRTGESGQVAVLVVVVMVTLLGMAGLAVDVGIVFMNRRELVRIADAAALAAASALTGKASEGDALRQARAEARARAYAVLHNFDPDTATNDLGVSFPETNPPRKLARVTANRTVPLAFMRVLGIRETTVSSGGRLAEAAPVDIVLVQDTSGSQCENNYNIDPYQGWCSRPRNPTNPSQYWSSQWPYRADQPTTRRDWPPVQRTGYRTNVPWSPFSVQQDAARYFIDQLDPRYDQIGIVSFSSATSSVYGTYSSDARTHSALTTNFTAAKDVIGVSPSTIGARGVRGLFPAGYTNMAAGIQEGVEVLTTTPARPDAVAVMILLSDGAPTVRLNGSICSSVPASCSAARQDTMSQAVAARNAGVVIYTIFAGAPSYATNDALMLQWIADLTDNGRLDGQYTGSRNLPSGSGPAFDTTWFRANVSDNFYLASDYAQLQTAYESIIEQIYTRLVN